jgi:hypothetical protein|tara:strand:- start:2379 stop:2996 length:618 start_codon:yes stop_codon:yes gene_type:complete
MIHSEQKKKLKYITYNFKKLGNINISNFKEKVNNLSESIWNGQTTTYRGKTHEEVRVIPIKWIPEVLKQTKIKEIHNNEIYYDLNFKSIEDKLKIIYKKNYGDGFLHKILLAKMPPKWNIQKHRDSGLSLMSVHRTHIPITTNKLIKFMVGTDTNNLKEGEVWEINNAELHAVNNESDKDRIHLIVDYYPYNGLSESFTNNSSLF